MNAPNTVLFCYPETTNSGFIGVASNFTCHPVNAAHIEGKCPKSPRKRTAQEWSRAFPRFGSKSTVGDRGRRCCLLSKSKSLKSAHPFALFNDFKVGGVHRCINICGYLHNCTTVLIQCSIELVCSFSLQRCLWQQAFQTLFNDYRLSGRSKNECRRACFIFAYKPFNDRSRGVQKAYFFTHRAGKGTPRCGMTAADRLEKCTPPKR